MLRAAGVQLEKIVASDRDDFIALMTTPELTALIGDGQPWQPEYAEALFNRMLSEQRRHQLCSLALRRDGLLAGALMLEQAEPKTVEVNCWLAPAWQRQGLAAVAFDELCEQARKLGYWRLVARCRVDNLAARRLAEKVGLRAVGVAGQRFGDGTALLFELTL